MDIVNNRINAKNGNQVKIEAIECTGYINDRIGSTSDELLKISNLIMNNLKIDVLKNNINSIKNKSNVSQFSQVSRLLNRAEGTIISSSFKINRP